MSSSSSFCFPTSDEQTLNILNIMAHDFRESLVYLSANLKLLGRGYYGNMDEPVKERLEEMLKTVNSLTHLFEEWMRRVFSFNEELEVQHEFLDLRKDIIDPILEECSTEMKDHGIKIDHRLGSITQNPIRIKANKIWLKAIFRNLIKNAIHHGDPGCTLAFGYEDHGSSCQVNVFNSGKPIPEKGREKLFTKLGQVENRICGSSQGMGVGLYLIKKMIQKQGGDIWYEAHEEGSNFVLSIPVASSPTSIRR